MSGKTLLASLLATCGLAGTAAATAGDVARGRAGMSAEDQTSGTESLEKLVEAAHLEGKNAGVTEGRRLERERFGAVLTSDEALGRTGLAITLLSTTENTPEQIVGALKAAPSIAETVSTAAGAEAGAARRAEEPQQPARDPIAAQTPLVDTGAPGGNAREADVMDEKQTAEFWGGIVSSISPSGVTAGGVWDSVFGKDARAN